VSTIDKIDLKKKLAFKFRSNYDKAIVLVF
jgi:hypothetical protein